MVRTSRLAALACLVALGTGAPPAAHAAPDTTLGRALYESRCTGCHDRSVHTRNPRAAQTFEQIRAYVYRWDRELGGVWTRDEIDAVASYLNERYYHLPCPQGSCGVASR
ncbi:MAG: hypothetical protein BGO72_10630 [Burkholderiales bacterium 70-64]|nr:MAG: hypothetical protein BGO72_10630 [Burkholderiales bacterium 70-64]